MRARPRRSGWIISQASRLSAGAGPSRRASAGPLRDTADGAGAGGLWLVEADGPDEVAALCKADPFWPTGLRKAVRVLAWMQVFADGKRRI
jgi:uncharacterized protein YciI